MAQRIEEYFMLCRDIVGPCTEPNLNPHSNPNYESTKSHKMKYLCDKGVNDAVHEVKFHSPNVKLKMRYKNIVVPA